MATNEILQVTKIEYSFQSSVYVPTGVSDLSSGTPTVVDLTLDVGAAGLADDAAANSDQVDFGATRPDVCSLKGAIEWFAAISAGGRVDFYWSGSANSAVASGNPGKPDGVDGAYTGDGGGTDEESVQQMDYIGSFITTDLQGVQIAEIGTFSPRYQYGQLIVSNKSGTVICGTDDIESSILMSFFAPDIAAAA